MSIERVAQHVRENSIDKVIKNGFKGPRIVVLGCGGAGCNSVKRLQKIGVYGAETIVINTDARHLERVDADKRVLIGKTITRGLGAGGRPDIGEQCAEQARPILRELLIGADLTFITVGMGGGTGTGVAPIIAEIAKHEGSVVVGIATTPFSVERGRLQKAQLGLEKLRKETDSLIVLDNNRLLDIVPNLPIDQAFGVMDQLISEVIKSVTEIITQPSLINLDYADVRTIMACGGTSTMLYSENSDQEPQKVVAEALNNPLLDIDYSGATGAIVHVTGGPHLSLRTANQVVEGLTYQFERDANIIYGVRILPEYEGRIKLMAIVTGVKSPNVLSSNSNDEYMMARDDCELGYPIVQ